MFVSLLRSGTLEMLERGFLDGTEALSFVRYHSIMVDDDLPPGLAEFKTEKMLMHQTIR